MGGIHAYIVQGFGKHYHPVAIIYVLKYMDFFWVTSRSKPSKYSQKVQNDHKKFETETINKIPRPHVGLIRGDVWFQDQRGLVNKTQRRTFGQSEVRGH